MIRSLRFRLTAGYLAFFAFLFAGFGIFLYHRLAASLERRPDSTLQSQAATAAGLFQDELVELNGDTVKAAAEAVSEIRGSGAIIAVFEDGRTIAASAPFGDSIPPVDTPRRLMLGDFHAAAHPLAL